MGLFVNILNIILCFVNKTRNNTMLHNPLLKHTYSPTTRSRECDENLKKITIFKAFVNIFNEISFSKLDSII